MSGGARSGVDVDVDDDDTHAPHPMVARSGGTHNGGTHNDKTEEVGSLDLGLR